MSSEKEQLARQKVIQKKQEQAEPGSQKDSGGMALSAGDMQALQGMVGNTAVGQLGQVQRASQNGNGQHVEQASRAAFQNIVQRTPSNGAPLAIQRKLEGTSTALVELGEGKKRLGVKSSWMKLIEAVQTYEQMETTISGKDVADASDPDILIKHLDQIGHIAGKWVKNNRKEVAEIRSRRKVIKEPKIVGNKMVEVPKVTYDQRAKSSDPKAEQKEDEINHQKMSAVQNLLVRIGRERQMINENFEAWRQSAPLADRQMAVSNWNEDYGAGGQASSLDKVEYQGNRQGFYQPDTNYNSPGTSGSHTGIPEHDPNFSGRALAMMRIDQLLTRVINAQEAQKTKKNRRGAAKMPAFNPQARQLPAVPTQQAQPMLVGTDIATHSRTKDAKTEATSGVFLDKAQGREMRGGYMETGNVLMSNTQRGANDQNKLSMDDPTLQRSLNKLQLLDAICAQVDRHAANFFVELKASGQVNSVEGIDNDMAFGHKLNNPRTQRNMVDGQDMGQTAWKGLPPIADEQLANAILAISPDNIIEAVNGLLLPAEIDATIDRLLVTQEHIKTLRDQNMLVDHTRWITDAPALAGMQTAENSYLGHMRGEAAEKVGKQSMGLVNTVMEKHFAHLPASQRAGFALAFENVMAAKIGEQIVSPNQLLDQGKLRQLLTQIVGRLENQLDEDETMKTTAAKVEVVLNDNSIYTE